MTCQHTRGKWVQGGTDDWTGEDLPDVYIEESTTEDIDTGRFRCTQCGLVMYYTGQWKDFYEKGIPCSGSDRVKRGKT
jgi:hypothetical protein